MVYLYYQEDGKTRKERKMKANMEAILKIGKEWKGGENHRVYFNENGNLLIGLEYMVYGRESKKGSNCKSSWLNGEEISNSKAFSLQANRAYYDVKAEKFYGVDESLILDIYKEKK